MDQFPDREDVKCKLTVLSVCQYIVSHIYYIYGVAPYTYICKAKPPLPIPRPKLWVWWFLVGPEREIENVGPGASRSSVLCCATWPEMTVGFTNRSAANLHQQRHRHLSLSQLSSSGMWNVLNISTTNTTTILLYRSISPHQLNGYSI